MKARLPLLSPCAITLLLFTIPVLFVNVAGFSQSGVFSPAAEDNNLLHSLAAKYEKIHKEELALLPSQNKKELEQIYKLRWQNIKEKFDTKEIYTSASAQKYLDALVAEIVNSNPVLQGKPLNCYFSRSGVPNAAYLGEGIILFNMGLFQRLNNESQAAFVISHEIAHFYLKHSENSIQKYVTTLNSPEVQKELRKIKSTEYGKREQVENLVKGLTFNSRRHSRDHENEADSMAIAFMRNTKFDITESLTTLAILDTIDKDSLNTPSILEKIFNAREYPFQKRWMKKEEGLLGGHVEIKEDQTLADSLKTHPACKDRMKILEPAINRSTTAHSFKDVIDKQKFLELRNNHQYEVIEYEYTSGNYTKSLYYTIQLLRSHSSDPWLISHTGRLLNEFYATRKAHTFGKHTDLPAPSFPSAYNMLLQFVQNLDREEFASLSYHFLKQHHNTLKDYQPFKEAYNTSIQIAQQ